MLGTFAAFTIIMSILDAQRSVQLNIIINISLTYAGVVGMAPVASPQPVNLLW